MKLISTILIITAMTLGITGCGNNADKGNDGSISDKVENGVDKTTDAIDDATNSVTEGVDKVTDDMMGDDHKDQTTK